MTTIPNYALYGDRGAEAGAPAWLGMVHFERIHERSSLYQYDIAPHIHEGLIQLLVVTRGGGSVFIDDRRWPIAPGTLIVIPTRHVHGFRFTPDIDGPVVTAAQGALESIAAVTAPDLLALMRRPLVLAVPDGTRHADALMPLLEAIEREARVQAGDTATAGYALLMTVFVQIARLAQALAPSSGADDAARTRRAASVERFRALVDAHFREHRPVEAYAAELGLSAGHLSRLCKEVLGRSSLDVINARLVHEAERELVYSILGVKQIAGLLGFADDAYFTRFFRKHSGRTPTAFRAAARQRLAPAAPAPGPALS